VKKRSKVSFDPKTFLAKVGDGKTISKYRKDQVVFGQGEAADAVFYIQQGKVKLTVVSDQGKEAVVAILGPGQFFGEGCLNGHPLRIATTRAVDECVITRLEKATMIATIHNEPQFSELFMSYLLSRSSRIEEDLIDQLFNRAMHLTQVTQFVVAGSCRNIHARCWSFAIGSRTMRRAGTISPSCGGRRGSAARYAEGRIIGSRRGACVTAGSAVGRPR
jgi:CRP-like cAMP-binding protein